MTVGCGPDPGVQGYPKRAARVLPVGTRHRARGLPECGLQHHAPLTARLPIPGATMPLPGPPSPSHNVLMERRNLQMSVAGLLGLVACFAVNLWLFRLGALWGILGLNVTQH